jgi:hypothetical protein
MKSFTCGRILACAAVAAAGVSLSACNSITYGTGTTPGAQTLKDVAGITEITGKKKEKIDYEPRPAIVVPPSTASLPQPVNGNEALGPNWPDDPDEKQARLKATVAALEAEGKHVDIRLPNGAAPPTEDPYAGLSDKERAAIVRKRAAQAKGVVAVDEFGNPVRRYLSDPPSLYREADPTAPRPTEIVDNKKQKKKWWQFWKSKQPVETPSVAQASTPSPEEIPQ